jgi:aminomethyltransferase
LSNRVHLQDFHEQNGHIVDFAGFSLPLWFKGIIPESLAVRNSVGIFDVSHMGRLLVRGIDSCKFLDTVTTNDVSSLHVGDGHYSLICNEKGGIRDDLVVFRLAKDEYMLVYNAANRSKDFNWLFKNIEGDVELIDVSDKVAMYALQGPDGAEVLQKVVKVTIATIPRFSSAWSEIAEARVLITRTGYTGEDGFEIFVMNSPVTNPQTAVKVWEKLLEAGKPNDIELCGLGARDVLRLEAGFCLYGTDMNESTNPYEAKLGFLVNLKKDFIGRSCLQEVKQKGTVKSRIALVTANRLIPRHGFPILRSGLEVGGVTSGTLSPILNKGIAMGYVRAEESKLSTFGIQVRDRLETVKAVKTPFYDTTKYGYARKQ